MSAPPLSTPPLSPPSLSTPRLSTQEPNPFAATGLHERRRAYAALAADGPVRRIALPYGGAAWLGWDPTRRARR